MHAKARHHLVEDQHGAVLVANVPQPLQKSRFRHHEVHVACDRLDDDAGDVVACLRECGFHRREIVVGNHNGLIRNRSRHARRRRLAERQRARAGFHEQAVAVTVIAALELHDLAAPGETAREPKRGHRGLGSG
jgi:hypothetical protein